MIDTGIPIYGLMILLSLVANIVVVAFISRKYRFTRDEIICLLLYENAGIILGAKTLTFLQNYKSLNGNFDILTLGLSSYGAVIGALLFIILFRLQFKKSLKEMLFIFMPSIPLMYAIGKVGCFLAGCCHGIEYGGFGNVVYRYSDIVSSEISLFPIQIVETVFFTGIFIYMLLKHRKNKFDIKTLGISFILCGFSKFSLDFLRMSHMGQIISLNQIISIVFIIIGVIMAMDSLSALTSSQKGEYISK